MKFTEQHEWLKPEGDEIVVKAPAGDVEYEIEKVEHL